MSQRGQDRIQYDQTQFFLVPSDKMERINQSIDQALPAFLLLLPNLLLPPAFLPPDFIFFAEKLLRSPLEMASPLLWCRFLPPKPNFSFFF